MTELSDAQGTALRAIKSGDGFPVRSRTGGALWRMLQRMTAAGLCEGPPFVLTVKGRLALSDWAFKQSEREARFMRRAGRR